MWYASLPMHVPHKKYSACLCLQAKYSQLYNVNTFINYCYIYHCNGRQSFVDMELTTWSWQWLDISLM